MPCAVSGCGPTDAGPASADEVVMAIGEQSPEVRKTGKAQENGPSHSNTLGNTRVVTIPEGYENIILRSPSGRADPVAEGWRRLNLEYRIMTSTQTQRRPSAAIQIKQSYGATPAQLINIKEDGRDQGCPFCKGGMDYELSYDVSKFLDAIHTRSYMLRVSAGGPVVFPGDRRFDPRHHSTGFTNRYLCSCSFSVSPSTDRHLPVPPLMGQLLTMPSWWWKWCMRKMETKHLSMPVPPKRGEKEISKRSSRHRMAAVFIPVGFMSARWGFSIVVMLHVHHFAGLVALTDVGALRFHVEEHA